MVNPPRSPGLVDRLVPESVIGAVTGTIAHPQDLLLGRYDRDERLRYVGRSTPLNPTMAVALGRLLTPSAPGHPWVGKQFSAGWRTRESIAPLLVEPHVVVEISPDAAQKDGRFRHLAKVVRVRPELRPHQVAKFLENDENAGG